jgi:hypothetical protein
MDASKPLSTALFVYECFRLLLLIAFLFIVQFMGGGAPSGSFTSGAFFPYIVYTSSNALFLLMALFMWLRPEEHRNYVTLYMAGKIIAVVSFYVWAVSSPRGSAGAENMIKSIILLGGSILVNMADILSVWGAWTLKRKYRKAESGGL